MTLLLVARQPNAETIALSLAAAIQAGTLDVRVNLRGTKADPRKPKPKPEHAGGPQRRLGERRQRKPVAFVGVIL